ncbi:MAG: PKD domain-containing protein [Ferruginibacter sp.]
MSTKAILRPFILLFITIVAVSFSSKAQLAADFSATPTSGCSPQIVNFTDLSTGNPTQWRWDLGNGTISFIQNPSATYFTAGQYTIKLVIQNAAGTADSITKTNYITVFAIPVVNFSATPTSGCIPLPVQFTDLSSAGNSPITTWLWDFGDGNTGNTQNPAHTYSSAGNFNVTLQVTNTAGCSKTLTKNNFIQASNGVTANFTNSLPTGCSLPVTINFTNTSTGPGTFSYAWDFGDGGTSTLPNPSHIYLSTGSYTVTLVVTSSTGCSNTIVKANAIVINFIQASFNDPASVCQNDPVNFINTTTPAPTSVLWSFGDATNSTALNPTKIYTTPGFYVVKLVTYLGACADSVTHGINVLPKPTVAFSAVNRTACAPPLTTNFSNTSTAGATYNWDFGDGGTSTLQNPSHTYTSYGSFNVKLVVTNFVGCSDSLVLNNYVQILAPQVTINNLPQSNCAPLTWTFSSTVVSPDPVVSYFWDFGDATTSTLPNPTHTFPVGSYDITLIVTTAGGCRDTAFVRAGIIADSKPTANLSATPRNVCAHVDVLFTDLSLGNVTRWLWYFGDGGTSTSQNPSHHYDDTGYFTVRLIVWNNNCPDTITFIDYIHINPPIAAFGPSFSCANRRTITFTDNSIGADEWHWDFGDGATSTSQNNIHTYPDSGTYVIRLVVVNHTTGCSDTTYHSIRIIEQVANFYATDTVICRNSSTAFYAIGNTPGTISTYDWDFGDGQAGSGASIAHIYTNAGLYTVRLIIADIAGCKDTLTKLQYIRVDGPKAAFTIPNGGSCLNNLVTFIDGSTNDGVHPIVNWIWNFGDGTTQSFPAPPFTHFYITPGSYTVTLKTIDGVGCADSTSNTQTIIISDPVADFTRSDTIACPNKIINFTNTSTGPNLTYVWNFGDGITSNATNPSHAYATEATYTVTLIITDQYGCTDSLNKDVQVAAPHASFTLSDSVNTCPPLIANFVNTSVNANTYSWDFGDGGTSTAASPIHIYNNPGTYIARLFISGPGNNCFDTAFKIITIQGPSGTFTYTPLIGCKPLTVNFTANTINNQSFIWDFNDGTTFNTPDSIISYTYTLLGSYVPKIILVDQNGCQVPIFGIDTINVKGVKAVFGYDGKPLCDLGIIQFTDSSVINDVSSTYAWNFGDGGTSTLRNPSHFYSVVGQYNPQLIVSTNSGCVDTATLPLPVQIVASPQADFTNAISGCTPVSATFNGILNVPDTSVVTWNWSLGNGNTSTLQNPPGQIYTTAQIYNIRLIATNTTGCKDTVDKSFEVYPIPVIDAIPNLQICRGKVTQLNAIGGATYVWSPATGLSCTNCANPLASPDSSTKYWVTGSSIYGCSNMDSLNVTVIQPFVMTNKNDDTICVGSTVRLFASGANSYQWSPSSGLSNPTSPIPVASPRATTTYMVVGSDAYGCFKDTGYTTIKVYPIPKVDAGKDVTMKNGGQPVVLTPTLSPDVTWTQWLASPGIIASNPPSITVKPKETTQYTVEVKNAGGCKSTDGLTVYVLCDGANVYIPNTFSPNGDGANDIFYPRGSGIFSIKLLRIFNRWGEVVFEKVNFSPNDPTSGWDGTVKGQKLTSDVYVYTAEILCENNTPLIVNGNIALLR